MTSYQIFWFKNLSGGVRYLSSLFTRANISEHHVDFSITCVVSLLNLAYFSTRKEVKVTQLKHTAKSEWNLMYVSEAYPEPFSNI